MSIATYYPSLEAVTESPLCQHLFHPVFQNNFSLVFLNRNLKMVDYEKETTDRLSVLNNAVTQLLRFTAAVYKQWPENRQLSSKEEAIYKKCGLFLELWRKDLEDERHFLSFDKIHFVVEGFRLMGINLTEQLKRQQPEIFSQLTGLDPRFKSFFRVDIYTGLEQVPEYFEEVAAMIERRHDLYQCLERVELTKTDYSYTLLTNSIKKKAFPTIMLYFRKELSSPRHPGIRTLRNELNLLFENDPYREVNGEFSIPFSRNSTITQGYRNYKKILQDFGLLDLVYDAGFKHAYVKENI